MQNAKPVFASGYGQSDTRAPILSDGRPNLHPSAGAPYKSVTGAEVVAMANSPASVAKDKAQWFIPSTYIGCDARTHDVQRTKGTFRWLTLDVDNNNLTLADVDATVSDVIGEAFRLIYSTRSATEGTGAEIGLTWQNGVFVADAPVTGLDRVAASAKAERVFLKLLTEFTEQGRRVNHASGANYAPKLFAENAKSEGCTKRVLKAAMDALLDSGKIAIEQDGPPSKRRTFLAAAGVRHCGSSA
jgi:hypothetical protein